MATVEQPQTRTAREESFYDPDGFPWLESGERLDWRTFHERYKRLPKRFKAELIGGIVYVMPSPLSARHGRGDFPMTGILFTYSLVTPGTVGQNNATTFLGEESTAQPDCALLIRQEYGGQTRDAPIDDGSDEEYTHGAPELVVEVAFSSRSLDLGAKLRDYERAGVLEYIVRDLRSDIVHWFALVDGRFEPISADADGIIRSRAFPGLWIDVAALLSGDNARAIAALNRGMATPEHAAFVTELEQRRAGIAAKG